MISTRYNNLKDTISEKTTVAEKNARYAAKAVDKSVHRKPWHYIAGFGTGALVIGYLFGRR